MTTIPKQKSGMFTLSVIFAGQFISLLASNASQFGLTLWILDYTGKATIMSVTNFFYVVPFLALSPFAGTMIDRYNRKVMMMVGDLCSFAATSFILVLVTAGKLEPWHLYVTSVVFSIGNVFQWPAYAAAISTLVSKEQYGRANGMLNLVNMGSAALSRPLAGFLLPMIGLKSILSIDVLTFFIAIGVLLLMNIPQPEHTSEDVEPQSKILSEALYGFQYIRTHLELRRLLVFSFLDSFLLAFNYVCPAMVFLRTDNDSLIVGSVLSSSIIGVALGGLVMTISGGWKRRIIPVLLSPLMFGIASIIMAMGDDLPVWLPANALRWIFVAMAGASSLAIWQAKVAQDIQGRVFAARRVLMWFSEPFVPLMASSLGDYLLEPAMQGGGFFSRIFDGIVGIGPGAGMALLLVFMGVAMIILSVVGSLLPSLRNIEITPDI